jgi:branched-chain amino acid transport system substrate-binding protein
MRRLPRSFAVLFLPLLLCGCGPKTEEEPIWIGCVAAFSGGDPSPGAAVKQGVALAVDDSAGLRVEGRRLSVIAADDRGSDETAQAETVRLLAVNHVAALIGGADPGRALRLARAAQPYGAPVVLPGDAAGPLPGDAVFTLCVRPAWRGQVLARYASGVLKAKRAFVLTDPRNPVAVELAAGFVQAWPTGEGETLEQATFQADADLPARTARAAAAKPDVVLIAATVSDFSQAAAQLATDGAHTPLLYGGEDVGVEPLALEHEGLALATVVAKEEFTERGKGFAKKYQDRFHETPDLPACQAYDAARLLFDALVRAKGPAADRVRDQIKAADFDSLTGPLRLKDGRAVRRVFVVALHEGAAKVVQTVDPEADQSAAGR